MSLKGGAGGFPEGVTSKLRREVTREGRRVSRVEGTRENLEVGTWVWLGVSRTVRQTGKSGPI